MTADVVNLSYCSQAAPTLARIGSVAAAMCRRAAAATVDRGRLRLVKWMHDDGAPCSR
jgi:hypothetical protein